MWARTVVSTRSGEKENDGLNKVSMLVFIKEAQNRKRVASILGFPAGSGSPQSIATMPVGESQTRRSAFGILLHGYLTYLLLLSLIVGSISGNGIMKLSRWKEPLRLYPNYTAVL